MLSPKKKVIPWRGCRPEAKRARLECLLLPRLTANLLQQIPRCPQHVLVRGVLSALVRWRVDPEPWQLRRLDAKAAGWLRQRPTEGGLARLAYIVKDFVDLGHRPDATLAAVGALLAGEHGRALFTQQVGAALHIAVAKPHQTPARRNPLTYNPVHGPAGRRAPPRASKHAQPLGSNGY